MSELAPTPSQEPLFRATIITPTELTASKEFGPILAWYKESCSKLPEMKVNITAVKDAKESTVNHAFFSYGNVDVTTPTRSWQQGGIVQRAESIPTKTTEKINAHGITILLTDPDGNTFVTVSQEPMASADYRDKTEIHPVVRSPLQTSAEKFKRVARSAHEGRAIDPTMTAILSRIAEEQQTNIRNILTNIPLSQSSTDGNRLKSDVLYGNLTVSKDLAAHIASDVKLGRWVTPAELDALTIMGVTNGNLNIARSVTQAQRRLMHP